MVMCLSVGVLLCNRKPCAYSQKANRFSFRLSTQCSQLCCPPPLQLSHFGRLKPAAAVRLSVVFFVCFVVWGGVLPSFCFGGSVVQPVASRVTCLRVAVVCCRKSLSLENAVSENRFSPLHLLNPTIFDCNSLTSVTSRLRWPVDSRLRG